MTAADLTHIMEQQAIKCRRELRLRKLQAWAAPALFVVLCMAVAVLMADLTVWRPL